MYCPYPEMLEYKLDLLTGDAAITVLAERSNGSFEEKIFFP